MKNKIPSNPYFDSVKKANRMELEKTLKKECLLIREESMKVLKEFEAIESDNY